MIRATTLSNFYSAVAQIPKDKKICLVPTMGALHKGHLSLIKKGLEISPYTIATIFVNPTQFNSEADLESYPRELQSDIAKLEEAGCYLLLAPSQEEIYPKMGDKERAVESSQKSEIFNLGGLDSYGEGPFRPGHFKGVVEVVSKLFDIVKPHYALFGEKDFQQLAIIKRVVEVAKYNIEIVGCPTVREDDGLAMSSRNALLSSLERVAAANIFKSLKGAAPLLEGERYSPAEVVERVTKKIEENPLLKVEYVELLDSHTLQPVKQWERLQQVQLCTAVYCGDIRLIDNIKLR
ncbi:MAG: pantoate--beta-alanine ligase [Bacteroidales bacterium]